MKFIPLTQGKFAQVDDEDYDYLMQWKWCLHKNKNVFYAKRRMSGTKNGSVIMMHRQILNVESGKYVDHKDLDGLNCTRTNMRVCNKSQNGANTKLRKNNKSGYLGVCLNVKTGKWKATISPNGRTVNIGHFNTPENAAIAYNIYAEKYYGEFARYNTVNT